MSAEEIPPPLSPTENEIMAARLATIVANSDDAIVSKTLEGVITSWNAGAERIFGYSVDEMVGQHITKIIPPELHAEEARIIAKLKAGERIEHFETVRVAKDGRRIHLSITVSPMRDSLGRIIGASKVARDITERKRAEEMQRLLLDELNHRIKNTLATVQAIATQTLRRAASPSDFVESFNGRIKAMARAHALLSGGSFQGAEITELVREQLLLSGEPDPRIIWSGPSITLEAQPALHLALVLHELGTNARKHGALSTPQGRVAVQWQIQATDGRSLRLHWGEMGGPPVRAPTTQGFGSILIEQSLRAHGGEVSITYAASGVTCQIDLPLPAEAQPISAFARDPGKLDSQSRRQDLKGKRILVVEDEPLIGMLLMDYLDEAGCIVVGPAQSLEKATNLARTAQVDGALVDGNLAGQTVDDVAQALRERGVPFAFVTGYGREALPGGCDAAPIVEKPFTEEQVMAALERMFTKVVSFRKGRRGA